MKNTDWQDAYCGISYGCRGASSADGNFTGDKIF